MNILLIAALILEDPSSFTILSNPFFRVYLGMAFKA